MNKNFIISFFTLSFIALFFFTPILTLADEPIGGGDTGLGSCSGGSCQLGDPLGLPKDKPAQALIGKVINAALGIVGSLALLMFIYGGFTWMLASGNAEAVTKGRNILIWATVGLVIIFSAYALVKFVFSGLGITPT